jgi:hypothetical protein
VFFSQRRPPFHAQKKLGKDGNDDNQYRCGRAEPGIVQGKKQVIHKMLKGINALVGIAAGDKVDFAENPEGIDNRHDKGKDRDRQEAGQRNMDKTL